MLEGVLSLRRQDISIRRGRREGRTPTAPRSPGTRPFHRKRCRVPGTARSPSSRARRMPCPLSNSLPSWPSWTTRVSRSLNSSGIAWPSSEVRYPITGTYYRSQMPLSRLKGSGGHLPGLHTVSPASPVARRWTNLPLDPGQEVPLPVMGAVSARPHEIHRLGDEWSV